LKKDIGFTQEELELLTTLIKKTHKISGSRKHMVCNDILEKIAEGCGWADLRLSDVESGRRYCLDFVWFAFPGLRSEGYRIEGFFQSDEVGEGGYRVGEQLEFGSLVLVDGRAKIVDW